MIEIEFRSQNLGVRILTEKKEFRSQKLGVRILVALLLVGNILFAQYKPAPENMKNREWFQDAKFGLFIHWGVYSVLGDGEWVMNNQQIPIETYEKLPSFF